MGQNRKISALIVAAGRGTRAGGGLAKQYREIGGIAMLKRAVAPFSTHPDIDEVIAVIPAGDTAKAGEIIGDARIRLVEGGATRALSVRAGLAVVTGQHVLIHDGARPFVSRRIIDDVIAALDTADAAAPALPVADALWSGDAGMVAGGVTRDGLYHAQTPQGFLAEAIRAAHTHADDTLPDDVGAARAHGIAVRITAGSADNFKVTTPEDFTRAERVVGSRPMDVRTGNGFDVHRFGPGDHVVLCGVSLPFGRGLQGHSDADVGLHAITDAIYGALADGDIGQHFPPSDPEWRGASSDRFLAHAVAMARERGFMLTHIDCTLICELPKIGPHQAAMRAAIAGIAGIEPARVSVKATTSERLGFTGRGEGIAAMATATLVQA